MGYKLLKRTRKFLGKTTGFADKKERNFEKNHLKAYLAGRKIFVLETFRRISVRIKPSSCG